MIRIETNVVINRPIEKVFEFLTSIENDKQWQSGILEAEQITEGPMGQGTILKRKSKFLSRQVESTLEIIEFESNRKIGFKTLSGPIPLEGGYSLKPTPEGGTEIVLIIEGDVSGFFKLAEPLVARSAQNQYETNLSNLKKLLETQA